MKFEDFIKRLALRNPERVKGFGRESLHAALIYKGNRVLSVGFNKDKTHPHQHRITNGLKPYLHAEIDVMQKLESESKRLTIMSIRVDRKGNLMDGKPCKYCMGEIRKNNRLSKLIYSIGGKFVEEKLKG